MFYIHRYLRLTPVLITAMLFTITIFKYMASGPIYKYGEHYLRTPCEKNWWTLLLYVQNYVWVSERMCLEHTWYLSINMQLIIISPLVLIPIWKYGKKCLWILPVLCLGSVLYIFGFFLHKDWRMSNFQ